MESALIVLVWIVGLVVITFFVVIIIAVLKVTSETDDIEERIHYQTTQALEEREHGISQETVGTGRGTSHVVSMGADNRNQQGDDNTTVATGLDNSRRVDGGRT